jgi:hypothetical protein
LAASHASASITASSLANVRALARDEEHHAASTVEIAAIAGTH